MTDRKTNGSRMRSRVALTAIGFALGVVVGSAGLSAAEFSQKGWERFGLMFRQGYMAGFIDAIRIAKNYDPAGYIAQTFPTPPRATAIHWVAKIDELYTKPEYQNRPLSQLIILAGAMMEKDFGDVMAPDDPRLKELRRVLEANRKAQRKAAAEKEKAGEKTKPDAAAEKKPEGTGSKSEAGSPEPPPSAQTDETPPKPEGSHGGGMLPEGSHPDTPIPHPQADPDAHD